MNTKEPRSVSASRFIAECDAGKMCQCGHAEYEHETVEYRGSKPRSCLLCKLCMAYRSVAATDDWESESDKLRARVAELESELKSALRDLAHQIVTNHRLVERLAKHEA